jgi:transcription antitermination factor NusG
MDKNEATWIAISALQYVIGVVKEESDGSPSYVEHIAEKEQALAILLKEVE